MTNELKASTSLEKIPAERLGTQPLVVEVPQGFVEMARAGEIYVGSASTHKDPEKIAVQAIASGSSQLPPVPENPAQELVAGDGAVLKPLGFFQMFGLGFPPGLPFRIAQARASNMEPIPLAADSRIQEAGYDVVSAPVVSASDTANTQSALDESRAPGILVDGLREVRKAAVEIGYELGLGPRLSEDLNDDSGLTDPLVSIVFLTGDIFQAA